MSSLLDRPGCDKRPVVDDGWRTEYSVRWTGGKTPYLGSLARARMIAAKLPGAVVVGRLVGPDVVCDWEEAVYDVRFPPVEGSPS